MARQRDIPVDQFDPNNPPPGSKMFGVYDGWAFHVTGRRASAITKVYNSSNASIWELVNGVWECRGIKMDWPAPGEPCPECGVPMDVGGYYTHKANGNWVFRRGAGGKILDPLELLFMCKPCVQMNELVSPIDPNIDGFAKFLAGITDKQQRERAIKQAMMLAANSAPEDAFEAPIKTLEDYLNTPIEVPPILVEPTVVVRGGITCTIGRAGKGKTVMNLNRCLKWAAGKPLFSEWKDQEGQVLLNPERPLKILVIENEGAGGLFHKQIGIMLHAEGYLTPDDRDLVKENLLIWGDGGYAGVKLDDDAKLDEVRRGCEKWDPDILFIEPFRGLWNGEENSATDMTKVVDALVDMATDYKAGILLAHHERKSGVGEDGEKMSAGRGSTVLEGVVSTMENFEGVKGGDFRELSWSKMRHGKAPNAVRMEWDATKWWYKHVAGHNIDEAILAALRESPDPVGVADLVELTGERDHRLRPRLALMVDNKAIKVASSNNSAGRGSSGVKYRLPTDEQEGNRGGLAV